MSVQSQIDRINGEVDKQADLIASIYSILSGKVAGIIPTGTKRITENGIYDVSAYAGAEVYVASPVQLKQGTFTVSGTMHLVSCGFKPDAVFFEGPKFTASYHAQILKDNHFTAGVLFTDELNSVATLVPPSGSGEFSYYLVTRSSNGFTVKGKQQLDSGDHIDESDVPVSYLAIKFTE